MLPLKFHVISLCRNLQGIADHELSLENEDGSLVLLEVARNASPPQPLIRKDIMRTYSFF